jgi:esterase/lipase
MLKFFISIAVVYLIIALLLFLSQKAMIYHPNQQDFYNCRGFANYEKLHHNGTRFYLKQGTSNKIVVYYHGNAGSACDRSYIKPLFERSGASLIFVEYAGYSNDVIKPSQKRITEDVKNIHDYISGEQYGQIVVYGQSLGSGAASYHAGLGDVDQLILVTPFSSMTDLVQMKIRIFPAKILLTEKYDNIKWLQDFDSSLLIVHGDQDQLIPHRLSEKLFQRAATQDKEYVLIEGSGHNDIWAAPVFQETMKKALEVVH